MRVPQLGGQQARAFLRDDPEIKRPSIMQRRHKATGIDDRVNGDLGQSDSGPVPVGEIDVAERKRAGNERGVSGFELALHPERPHPVQIVLDRLYVYETPGMEHDARAQKLDGFLDFRRPCKRPQAGEPGNRVHHLITAGGETDDESPWKKAQHGVGSFRRRCAIAIT